MISCKNPREINQKLDQLPGYGPWLTCDVQLPETGEKFKLHYRDPIEAIQELWANPAFKDNFSYAPKRCYVDKDCTIRQYNEMSTGDFWWEVQVRDQQSAIKYTTETISNLGRASSRSNSCAYHS